jgi:hypothetical protein
MNSREKAQKPQKGEKKISRKGAETQRQDRIWNSREERRERKEKEPRMDAKQKATADGEAEARSTNYWVSRSSSLPSCVS